jgi:hypothetical protein
MVFQLGEYVKAMGQNDSNLAQKLRVVVLSWRQYLEIILTLMAGK